MSGASGWMSRLKEGLRRSSDRLRTPLVGLFKKTSLSAETFETLEEILLQSDMGVAVSAELTQRVQKDRWPAGENNSEAVLHFLSQALVDRLKPFEGDLAPLPEAKPWVCVLVGVNGSGKTTTAGKLAARWGQQHKQVGLVAGDTFRAAAREQLEIWANRTSAHLYGGPPGCDSAALAFESVQDARRKGLDCLFIDTAGRLHNKTHLMEELAKLSRVLKKHDPALPHCTLLVLDATVGQNAVTQVELFQKAIPLSGLIVTKLDGSAKGGILLDLTHRFQLPLYGVGVGEGLEDLQRFDAQAFASALLGFN